MAHNNEKKDKRRQNQKHTVLRENYVSAQKA